MLRFTSRNFTENLIAGGGTSNVMKEDRRAYAACDHMVPVKGIPLTEQESILLIPTSQPRPDRNCQVKAQQPALHFQTRLKHYTSDFFSKRHLWN